MTKVGKELRSRYISRNKKFDYLPDADRYLSATVPSSYKFAIIGSGNIGQEHMRVTLMEGRASIQGIYDPNPKSIDQATALFSSLSPGSPLTVYSTLQEACHDPEVDALIICTPNYTHIDIVKEAITSGKHILLEKPMATTLEDAYTISNLAKDYDGVFQIGLQYRYKAIYSEAIHEALERKSLGEIKMINMMEHRMPFLDKVAQWNKFAKYSGGTLVEKCCHYFDLMNLFAQSKPVEVYASGGMDVNFTEFKYNSEPSDIVDNAMVTVLYENGVRASFQLCMFSPMFYEELVLCGNEGRLKTSENEDFLGTHRPRNQFEIMLGEGKPSRITTPCYPSYIEESGHGGATYYEHEYFIDNIEKKPTSTARVDEGLWSVIVGVAAEQSMKSGTVVQIDQLLQEKGIHV